MHTPRARVADLEREVTEAQEENVPLSQRAAQLEAALRDAEGANHNCECAKQLEQSAEDLTREAGRLREQLVKALGDLVHLQLLLQLSLETAVHLLQLPLEAALHLQLLL